MKNTIATAILAVGLIVGGAAAAAAGASFTVAETTVEDQKAVFATVESVDVIAARARIGGTVGELAVDEGARVENGQVIARVHDAKLRIRLAGVSARIESLKSQRKLAAIGLERVDALRRSGTVSQARLDAARTDLEVVDRNLAAMQAERGLVVQQQAEGAVKAPAAGRVLAVHVTAGSVVLAGETIATIAAETYVLRLQLPERHARFIGVGDAVLVGGRGLAEQAAAAGEWRPGRIRQVYPRLRQGRVVADVEVDGLGDFFVGERVRVSVATGERPAYVVPRRFLFRRHGLTFVRLEDGGEAVVQPGEARAGGIEILSGVRPGDVLLEPETAP